jgi:hypothetical protein
MAENEELSAAWEEVSKGVDQKLRKLKKERQRVHNTVHNTVTPL